MIEKRILDAFLFHNSLKFNEIEKKLKIRSNKLAYHLRSLLEKQIISKRGDNYSLSDSSEEIIPYLSDKKAILPVILIHLGNERKVFLHIRKKRPYQGYLSLPGGRILVGESISDAVERIMKEKFSINAELTKVNSVSLEKVRRKYKVVHSFFLIFVTASSRDLINYLEIKKNKNKIIKSDYKLLTTDLTSTIPLRIINSET